MQTDDDVGNETHNILQAADTDSRKGNENQLPGIS